MQLCDIKSLTAISVCNNHIQKLPAALSNMLKLKRLWFDWNQVEFLPQDFERLKSLKSLKVGRKNRKEKREKEGGGTAGGGGGRSALHL